MRLIFLCVAALAACSNEPQPKIPYDLGHDTPIVDYIDCDMSTRPKLYVDGGRCVHCASPNRPCCDPPFICLEGFICEHDAGTNYPFCRAP